MPPVYTPIEAHQAAPDFWSFLLFFGAVGFLIGLMLIFCLTLHNAGKRQQANHNGRT